MVNRALDAVLSEERNIQLEIEQAKRSSAQWLVREKEAILHRTEEMIASSRDECAELIARAEQEAGREVASEVTEAEAYGELLQNLPDKTLAKYLKKYLGRILPED